VYRLKYTLVTLVVNARREREIDTVVFDLLGVNVLLPERRTNISAWKEVPELVE